MQKAPELSPDYPVFSREEFDRATLCDIGVQRELIEAFLKEAATCRAELASMARCSPERFSHAMHRLKGGCHYMAGLRLFRLLDTPPARFSLDSAQGRERVAECIIEELVHLERALANLLAERVDA